MPDPISHAEMIAAINQRIEYLDEMIRAGYGEASEERDAMRAIRDCLERTQPTGIQADLADQALAVVTNWYDSGPYIEELAQDVAAFAAEARRAAIEDAAKVCDGIRDEYLNKPRRDPDHDYTAMAGYCAGAIRALASAAPQEER